MTRTIKEVVTGSIQYDGAGVKLVRVVGHNNVKNFDPFLLMDAFDSVNSDEYTKGFPWHPHRGIETVTYLIRGKIEHSDSLGNKGAILDGCCQWMTAGSGIMHQEMPMESERMLGVQLWLNLPAQHKMTPPQYHDITENMVPKITENGCTVRVIAGSYKNTKAVSQGDYVKMQFLDVDLEPDASFELPTAEDETLFVYIVEGEGYFESDEQNLQQSKTAILFNSGDKLVVKATQKGIRFLSFSAKPLYEPVVWGGPIVMNTREELDQAFAELKNSTFIKPV